MVGGRRQTELPTAWQQLLVLICELIALNLHHFGDHSPVSLVPEAGFISLDVEIQAAEH